MIEELKKIILSSAWNEENKKQVIAVLELLGENFLNFLYNESNKLGFSFAEESLTEVVVSCVNAEKQLLLGDSTEADKILAEAPGKAWWENGVYVLPWALDLQQKVRLNKKFQDTNIQVALVRFYLKMFEFIPEGMVTFVLKSFSLFAIVEEKVDLLLLLKKYVYKKHWEGDVKYVKPFADAMFVNNEVLSPKQILFEDKQVPMSVTNMIKDFIGASARNSKNLTVYDITKYLISSKNVSILSAENKEALLEILKIFLWFQKPIVTRSEIGFEEENLIPNKYINSQQFNIPQEVLETQQNELTTTEEASSIGTKLNINIDQKLEDLKKRAKK